jgi:hypothetical protein
MPTIFIVSDVGTASPCRGIIFAAFNDLNEAVSLAHRINAMPEQWGFDEDAVEDECFVCVTPVVIGEIQKGGF